MDAVPRRSLVGVVRDGGNLPGSFTAQDGEQRKAGHSDGVCRK